MFGGSSSRCRGSVCAGSVMYDCGVSYLYSLAVLGSLLYLEIYICTRDSVYCINFVGFIKDEICVRVPVCGPVCDTDIL